MSMRATPPIDITPHDFFTRWIPEIVGADDDRSRQLSDTNAVIEFEITGKGGGYFSLYLREGRVYGKEQREEAPDLKVRVDLPSWRQLNSGALSAPEAFLTRRVELNGNLRLAAKLHFILG